MLEEQRAERASLKNTATGGHVRPCCGGRRDEGLTEAMTHSAISIDRSSFKELATPKIYHDVLDHYYRQRVFSRHPYCYIFFSSWWTIAVEVVPRGSPTSPVALKTVRAKTRLL